MHPPQHSITAESVWINARAFDIDRCLAERKTMPDEGGQHPLSVYLRGDSRYDLDASYPVGEEQRCARDYLLPGHGYTEWRIRRIKPMEVTRCRDIGGDSGKLVAFALAMGQHGRPLSDAKVEAAVDEYGLEEILAIGEAALSASEAPKAAEKKR